MPDKFKVLVTDKISPIGLKKLEEHPLVDLVMALKPKEDQLKKELPDTAAWLVRSETKVTAPWIEQAKNLKLIGRAGVGVDNIDVDGASRSGVAVVNAPAANTISACEHTFGLMLALSRNIAAADATLKKGGWDRAKFMGVELQGKTLGLVGLGRIGREVAKRARAFGMQVVAYDPFMSEKQAETLGAQLMPFKKVMQTADYISLHVPVSEKTKDMVNGESLGWCKDGARIINCARGELVDVNALLKAIESGKLAGAALDVYTSEPLPEDSPLRKIPQLLLTPHLGASTKEAQLKVAEDLAESVIEFFEKGLARNAINLPGFDPETLEKLGKDLELADTLGRFLGQMLDAGLKGVHCRFHGDYDGTAKHPLSVATLKGMLSTILEQDLSFINAPILALERGIETSETTGPAPEGHKRLLSVTAVTDKGERSISGTVDASGTLHIVRLDDLRVDVAPQGRMLVLSNSDEPGIIGKVGTLLGKHKINIADMRVGRKAGKSEAVMVISTDDAPDEKLIKELKAQAGINTVRWVVL
jgi:D-3-phosphoglycerate dehydrogenase